MKNSTKPNPECYIYERSIGKWLPFQSIIIYMEDSLKEVTEFFKYKNTSLISSTVIHKKICYDCIVYHSKFVPSAVTGVETSSVTSNLHRPIKESDLANSLNTNEIKCMIILEDLSLRYESTISDDQYVLLGFKVKNSQYGGENHELKFIRDLIAELHWKLKYSEGGLVYQVSQRIRTILYKSLKYSLCYVCSLCNLPSEVAVADRLQELQRLHYDSNFQDYLNVIVKSSPFAKEVTSLVYKAFLTVGIFPAHVELNTMNEAGIWIKIKNIFANKINAPYGSQHHASFSLGNFRYSFIFQPGNKEKQRVSISSEIKRGFAIKNQTFDYFRLKFFDFFPMDSWIQIISGQVLKLLQTYLEKILDLVPENLDTRTSLKEFLWFLVEEQEDESGKNGVSERIARMFYDRYRAELDSSLGGKAFKRMTRLISDAEVRGYKNLSNNCQTIVAEIISVFSTQFQPFIEPLFDLTKLPHVDEMSREEILGEFLHFGSQFNYNFCNIAPFSMTQRISYFETFSDKDSCELLHPKNIQDVHDFIQKYRKREHVKSFLDTLEDEILLHSKIHLYNTEKGIHEPTINLPDIKFDTGDMYSKVSCLLAIIYNALFNAKREIKIARLCEEKLEDKGIDPNQSLDEEIRKKIEQDKDAKKMKTITKRLPELYERKYRLLEMYKELCFYYYNTVRLGVKIKISDNMSFIGFLLTKKPDHKTANEKKKDESKGEENNLEFNVSVSQSEVLKSDLINDDGSLTKKTDRIEEDQKRGILSEKNQEIDKKEMFQNIEKDEKIVEEEPEKLNIKDLNGFDNEDEKKLTIEES